MPASKKLLIWLLVVSALGGGLYFYLKKEKNIDLTSVSYWDSLKTKVFDEAGTQLKNSAESAVSKGANDIAGKIIEGAKEKTYNAVEGGLMAVIEKTGDVLGVSKEKATSTAQSQSGGTSLGQSSAGSDNSAGENQARIISYVIKINERVYFNIGNPFPDLRSFRYQMDWGDGVKEEQNFVEDKDSRIISHIWKEEGEKLIQFKILNGEPSVFDSRLYVMVSK